MLVSINLSAQAGGIVIGTDLGAYPEQSIRIAGTQQWKWVRQEYSVSLNIKGEIFLRAKMGFGLNTKRWDLFAYLPYLNFNTNISRYNTPASFEIFFKKRRSKNWYDKQWFPNVSACFDVYRDRMIPILRLNYTIIEFD